MTEVSPTSVETERRTIVDMPAVQGRILLRDRSYLDPTKTTEAPLLTRESVVGFADRSYGLFENASFRERRAYSRTDMSQSEKYEK